ncbi:cardioacceleratory peptide receptor [Nephila pilipes]|uniref:Cardioacceleratory peptide receptor n=1 Tax=Nephila pilipes TaxID=299642 RepID=A0A8X6PIU4_NEPPI|nr:cardioacceleratory peptide receptor [Nephila pilipes]
MAGPFMEISNLELDESYMKENYINGTNDTYIGSFGYPELPYYLTLSKDAIREIILYSIMFLIAAIGNIPVFVTLLVKLHRYSRVNLMIMHLAIADLIVTFVMIPYQIARRIAVQWMGNNVTCKAIIFLSTFVPYLSSSVLVCICMDRYFAILHPLKVNDAQRRCKIMLAFAWAMSVLFSIPQSIIFHVQNHPKYTQFVQCGSFNFFPNPLYKLVYKMLCLLVAYGVPLAIISFCCFCILWKISRRSKFRDVEVNDEPHYRQRLGLRRTDFASMEKARARTLQMTIIIVMIYFICWTPHIVMALWYGLDPESAKKVDIRIQSFIFQITMSHSFLNPMVYGSYVLDLKQMLTKCCCKAPSAITVSGSCAIDKEIPFFEPVFRDVSVHFNEKSSDTYSVPLKDINVIDSILQNANRRPCSCSDSSSNPYVEGLCAKDTSQKVEVVIHSLGS